MPRGKSQLSRIGVKVETWLEFKIYTSGQLFLEKFPRKAVADVARLRANCQGRLNSGEPNYNGV